MFLSRHKTRSYPAPVYLGIPRHEAVVCEACNLTTKAVNARCGACHSDAVSWVSSIVPGRPKPPSPTAALVSIPILYPAEHSIFQDLLLLVFRLLKPSYKSSSPVLDWDNWTKARLEIEEKLAVPAILRSSNTLHNHPAA